MQSLLISLVSLDAFVPTELFEESNHPACCPRVRPAYPKSSAEAFILLSESQTTISGCAWTSEAETT